MNVVKEYRNKLGLTQAEFGARYGMSKGSVWILEHDENRNYTKLAIEPGDTYGRFTVIKKERGGYWECSCVCGQKRIFSTTLLTREKQSCECRKREDWAVNKLVDQSSLCKPNEKISKRNTSGFRGVYFNKHLGKWIAQISSLGVNYYLGSFALKGEAIEARRKAEDGFFPSNFKTPTEDKSGQKKRMENVEGTVEESTFYKIKFAMRSGRIFETKITNTELDWLYDKLFGRSEGKFQNFSSTVVSIDDIEWIEFEYEQAEDLKDE